jgi:DNA-binding transcriptional LysR family regulator
MQVQTIMSLVASGLGVGLVAGVSHLVQPRGVKCLPLLDNPPGFHVGIALVHSLTPGSRAVESSLNMRCNMPSCRQRPEFAAASAHRPRQAQ